MYPIQTPHYVRGEMDWHLIPIIIYVVAQLLKEFGNEMCADGLMLAIHDLDAAGALDACKAANSLQCLALK